MSYGGFNIFADRPLSPFLEAHVADLKQHVQSEQPDYILNVNEQEYITFLTEKYRLEPLAINVDGVTVDSYEKAIPAEYFARGYDVRPEAVYTKPVVRYHIPVSGNTELLWFAPSSGLLWSEEVLLDGDSVCFEIIDFNGDSESIKRQASGTLNNIRAQALNVQKEVERHNSGLGATATQIVKARKAQLQAQHGVLASLGVPIRKSGNIPQTFAVPTVRKKIVARPQAAPTAKQPVPTLDAAIYEDILRTIHEMGKVFERYPSTYKDKDEEALRDHLILQLEPRFEGSTTGETFNKSGKTDILIRHEKKNIFVAECKFWNGKAHHFKTIDQILSYLTWRDSKTAIVYFVKRKDMSGVLKEIAEQTLQHPNFVLMHQSQDPSWQRFEFHLPGDPGSKIQLTILAFHFPD